MNRCEISSIIAAAMQTISKKIVEIYFLQAPPVSVKRTFPSPSPQKPSIRGSAYGTAQTFALSLERERFTRTEESGDDTLDLLNDCDLLIIDDLGMEISSSYIMSAIYNVIDTRIMLKKPTIISTNLSMLELEKRYTERFVSRVIGFYDRLPFRGKDIRMQKKLNPQNKQN